MPKKCALFIYTLFYKLLFIKNHNQSNLNPNETDVLFIYKKTVNKKRELYQTHDTAPFYSIIFDYKIKL